MAGFFTTSKLFTATLMSFEQLPPLCHTPFPHPWLALNKVTGREKEFLTTCETTFFPIL